MKKANVSSLLFAGIVFAACNVLASDPADYLKLTRANLPHMQTVIQAAINDMDISMSKLEANKRKLRASALLPEVWVNANLYEKGVPEYDVVPNSFTYNSPGNIQQYDGWSRTGDYDERLDYGVQLTWDLSGLVWGVGENEMSTILSRRASNIRRRIEEVGRRYVLLSAALPKDASERVSPNSQMMVLEHAIYLDNITGGLLSRVLRQNDALNDLRN